MNDHDIDLIVDLIESQLSASEAESALARIMADPELSAAYAEQLSVRSDLEALPTASMTAAEKDALNTALVGQLRLDATPVAVPVPRNRKAWWAPVIGITAAAAAVTAIFIVPGMSGSDDSSSDTTIVASAAARAPEDTAEDGSAEFGVSEEEAPVAQSPTNDEQVTVVELDGADLVDVLDATAGESTPEAVQDQLSLLGYTELSLVSEEVLAECISSISAQVPAETTDIVLFGVDTSGPTQIAHIGLIFDDGIGAAMSVDLATCTVVDLGN